MSLILVTGGTRSGKSKWAEHLATQLAAPLGGRVIYMATAEVRDMEMRIRVAKHRKGRPRKWRSIDAPRRVGQKLILLNKNVFKEKSVLILDSVTHLVDNLMRGDDPITDADQAAEAVQRELRPVLLLVRERNATIIMVTDEMGTGGMLDDDYARRFRDVVGTINQWLAAQAKSVWLVASGFALPLDKLGTMVPQD